jgi:hypothetical protein
MQGRKRGARTNPGAAAAPFAVAAAAAASTSSSASGVMMSGNDTRFCTPTTGTEMNNNNNNNNRNDPPPPQQQQPSSPLERLQTESILLKSNDFFPPTLLHSDNASNHWGLTHILRQWIATSFSRRTFHLLEKAVGLANKYKISMDRILCGDGMPQEWIDKEIQAGGHIKLLCLSELVLMQYPKSTIATVPNTPMLLEDIPLEVLQLMRCVQYKYYKSTNNSIGGSGSGSGSGAKRRPCLDLGNRWIFIREIDSGRNRFYTSPAFERDIVSWSTLRQTFMENKQQMLELWMPDPKERAKYGQSFVHQIVSTRTPYDVPPPDRVAGTYIQLVNAGGGRTVQVDSIFAFRMQTLDRSYGCLEYIPSYQLQDYQAAAAAVAAATVAAAAAMAATEQLQKLVSRPYTPFLQTSPPVPPVLLSNRTLKNLSLNENENNDNDDDDDYDDDDDNDDDDSDDDTFDYEESGTYLEDGNDENEQNEAEQHAKHILFGDIPEFQGQFDDIEDWLEDVFDNRASGAGGGGYGTTTTSITAPATTTRIDDNTTLRLNGISINSSI